MSLPVLQSAFGLLAFVLIAWILSENRRGVRPRLILIGLGLQLILAVVLLKLPVFRDVFLMLNRAAEALEEGTRAGTGFVFGYLGGGPLPFNEPYPGAAYIFAFRGLPVIVVTAALSSLLYYWKVIPVLVRGVSCVLQRTMGIGGALGIGCAANIFAGMVESPMFVRPYISTMTRSELFTLMTCGMATIAGTVLVLYAGIVGPVLPGALGHILTASLISVPASILISAVMVPESGEPTIGDVSPPSESRSSMDAVVQGTTLGVKVFISVAALLVVLVALASMLNQTLGLLPAVGDAPLTLQRILGWIMSPLVWLTGIPWSESQVAGSLMGTKIVLNELLAYLELAAVPAGALSERSILIMTYSMCGFANVGSLGILIGGLTRLAPERSAEIVELGPRSVLAGVLATMMTGAVVGVLY
jgi:CNT family concentrative nucleoside transporter